MPASTAVPHITDRGYGPAVRLTRRLTRNVERIPLRFSFLGMQWALIMGPGDAHHLRLWLLAQLTALSVPLELGHFWWLAECRTGRPCGAVVQGVVLPQEREGNVLLAGGRARGHESISCQSQAREGFELDCSD